MDTRANRLARRRGPGAPSRARARPPGVEALESRLLLSRLDELPPPKAAPVAGWVGAATDVRPLDGWVVIESDPGADRPAAGPIVEEVAEAEQPHEAPPLAQELPKSPIVLVNGHLRPEDGRDLYRIPVGVATARIHVDLTMLPRPEAETNRLILMDATGHLFDAHLVPMPGGALSLDLQGRVMPGESAFYVGVDRLPPPWVDPTPAGTDATDPPIAVDAPYVLRVTRLDDPTSAPAPGPPDSVPTPPSAPVPIPQPAPWQPGPTSGSVSPPVTTPPVQITPTPRGPEGSGGEGSGPDLAVPPGRGVILAAPLLAAPAASGVLASGPTAPEADAESVLVDLTLLDPLLTAVPTAPDGGPPVAEALAYGLVGLTPTPPDPGPAEPHRDAVAGRPEAAERRSVRGPCSTDTAVPLADSEIGRSAPNLGVVGSDVEGPAPSPSPSRSAATRARTPLSAGIGLAYGLAFGLLLPDLVIAFQSAAQRRRRRRRRRA